jgi:hypothetical protein
MGASKKAIMASIANSGACSAWEAMVRPAPTDTSAPHTTDCETPLAHARADRTGAGTGRESLASRSNHRHRPTSCSSS